MTTADGAAYASRPILISDENFEAARGLRRLFKDNRKVLEDILGLQQGQFSELTRGINCRTCGASAGAYCRTGSGRVTSRSHTERMITILAAVFAAEEEIVINEEPDALYGAQAYAHLCEQPEHDSASNP